MPWLYMATCINALDIGNLYRHSLWTVASKNFVCLCVCPAFTAYILVTMGWILIKIGENVGT